jgi:UDP-glucose 4-epimerase
LSHQNLHLLVTGGAGFIGSHLIERLVQDEVEQITVFDNLHRGRLQSLAAYRGRIRFISGDIRDEAALHAALVGVDVVFHLAAQSNVVGSESDPHYTFSTNVLGTFNVLRAARDAGVRRVVFSSSREVYGDAGAGLPVPETTPLRPKNNYGASKAAGEAYCSVFDGPGLKVVILRLANVYGPGDFDRVIPIFLRNGQDGAPLVIFGGSQVLDFVWIADVVNALVRAASLPNLCEPVNIGSGVGTSVLDLANIILKLTGSRSVLRILPARTIETCCFVADTRRMQTLLGPIVSEDVARRVSGLLTRNATQGVALQQG